VVLGLNQAKLRRLCSASSSHWLFIGFRWRRRAGCGWYVGAQADLPRITLTDLNGAPVALKLLSTPVLVLNGAAPFPAFPYIFARVTYSVWGILIVLREIFEEMHLLEQVYIIFLDSLSTVDRST
jgi:hypothetical protein